MTGDMRLYRVTLERSDTLERVPLHAWEDGVRHAIEDCREQLGDWTARVVACAKLSAGAWVCLLKEER